MSRLADKIKRAHRMEAAPIGFGVVAERRASPTLLCLLRLDRSQAEKNATKAAAADAVIITGMEAEKLAPVLKKLGDIPVGLELGPAERSAVAAAREAGADFVLLNEQSPAEAVLEERVGFVLSVGTEVSDAELRALGGLSLDALEVPAVKESLTLRQLMELRRLSMLSQTPLFIEIPAEVGRSRLETLRDAGAVGVIIDGKSAGNLAALREAVLSLPPRGHRGEERTEALLPSLTGVPGLEVEEDPDSE
jgi:hypothetical protein